MIFLDTSAIYAMADKADPNHAEARKKFEFALESRETFLLHNYILIESAALIQSRLGLRAALLFLKDAKVFEIEWIDSILHNEALMELERVGRRGVSLVDCASFIIMRKRGLHKVLAFDPDFDNQGFIPL